MAVEKSKHVLLRLPVSLALSVDTAAGELGQTRSSFIRQAVSDRLDFYISHEKEAVGTLVAARTTFHATLRKDRQS